MQQKCKFVFAIFLASSFLMTPMIGRANANDFIKGVAVGVGGKMLIDRLNRNKKKSSTRSSSSAKSSGPRSTIAEVPTTRDEVRDIQRMLNQLGYDAGTADGVAGKRTRTAVMSFQGTLGAPQTGKLATGELATLRQQTGRQLAGVTQQGQPSAQFPTIAPAINGQATGATVSSANSSSAFPTIPGTVNNAVQQPAPQFPVIAPSLNGQAQSPATAASAFPTIPNVANNASPVSAVQQPAPQFPVIAPAVNGQAQSPTTANGASKFPTLPATSGNDAQPPQVALVQPATAPATPQAQTELPVKISPSIFGIKPGMTRTEVVSLAGGKGYTECKEVDQAYTCERELKNMNDTLMFSVNDEDDTLVVAARLLEFTNPVKQDFISGRLEQAYPGLVNAPDMKFIDEKCRSYIADMDLNTSIESGIMEYQNDGEFAVNCQEYYSISFEKLEDANQVKSSKIVLYHAPKSVLEKFSSAEDIVDDELEF